NGEALVIEVGGRLDATTAPELEKTIDGIPADVKELVIDMEKLEYISSAGLRVLLAAHKKMAKVGAMRVRKVCDEIMEILDMTGFTDILTIEE
ncbi:MAG: STAS domain-containing protein, partial [Ruminiclostridium sp.]